MPRSALHQVDVLDRDRATIAVVGHQDGEPDRCFRRRDGEHQERKDLTDHVAEERRERDEIDVDREQDQLDRHQDDDHVLPVEEDAEDAEREQDGSDREIVAEADGHDPSPCPQSPWPARTFTTSIAVALVRATWLAMLCRLTLGRWCKLSTMAPIMATSSTTPATWKK